LAPHYSQTRAGGTTPGPGFVLRLLLHRVEFFFDRGKALQDFMDAHGHVADGLYLGACGSGERARLEQQQLGISQDRRKRVVQRVPLFQHVLAQRGLPLQRVTGFLGASGAHCRLAQAQNFR